MTSQAQSPQKVGGSLFLLIPHAVRGELDGSEPMHWTKTGPRTYAITTPQSGQTGNSRTLRQGGGVKVRIPREAINAHGPDRPWTIRQEDGRLIAEATDEGQTQPIKPGDVVETKQGPAVVIRATRSEDGRALCAYLSPSPPQGSGLKIEAGEWRGYTVDLTHFVVMNPAPGSRKGAFGKTTQKAIHEALSPLF